MAGTINLAMTQQFDMDGNPLSGGKLYFFAAGTTTPQNAFQDVLLTIPHPNPIILDASGRVPMFYLADGNIKIRLADENDVTMIAADQLLVVGPSVPASSIPPPPDASAQFSTGDIKARYGTGTLTGWVRCNGRSISKSGAGGTESASDDNQDLFEYLWSFANITLNTAKGGTANGDWLAGRQLNLPDLRGRTIAGLDDMGASGATRLTAAFFGVGASNASGNANGNTVGNAGGDEKHILVATELAQHSHNVDGDTSVQNTDHTHALTGNTQGESVNHTHGLVPTALVASGNLGTLGASNALGAASLTQTDIQSVGHVHALTGNTLGMSNNHFHSFHYASNMGNGLADTPHNNVAPTMVMTFYIKK